MGGGRGGGGGIGTSGLHEWSVCVLGGEGGGGGAENSGTARVESGAPSYTTMVVLNDWNAESRCNFQDELFRYCPCCVSRGPPLAVL